MVTGQPPEPPCLVRVKHGWYCDGPRRYFVTYCVVQEGVRFRGYARDYSGRLPRELATPDTYVKPSDAMKAAFRLA